MNDGPELTNEVAGAVERVEREAADLELCALRACQMAQRLDCSRLPEAALDERKQAAKWTQEAADLRTLLAIAADHARLAQATGEAKSALPPPCYTMSGQHQSGYQVVLGYETLADAQVAQEFVARTALSLLQEGEAGNPGPAS